MGPTIVDFNNLAEYQIGVPYVFGGVWLRGSAYPGLDCSGLPYAVSLALGKAIPRTSEAQYAGLPHVPAGQERRGDLVTYDVPTDTQPQPAHVAIWWSPSLVLQAPRTGENVGFSPPLPYRIMAIVRLPFPDAVPTPAPTPGPSPAQLDEETMYAFQNTAGKTVIVGKDQTSGNTVVLTSDSDGKVSGGWSEADVTAAIQGAYPGHVVKLD